MWFFLTLFLSSQAKLLYEGRTTAVQELDYQKFQSLVKENKNSIVVFYAHWCGHCKDFAPQFIKIAHQYAQNGELKFGAVDCATPASFKLGEDDLCKQFDVRAYPTVLLFSDGKKVRELAKVSGDLEAEITELVDGNFVFPPPKDEIEISEKSEARTMDESPQAFLEDAELAWYQIFHDSVFPGAVDRLSPDKLAQLKQLLDICGRSFLSKPFRGRCTELVNLVQSNPQGLSRQIWIGELDEVFGNQFDQKSFVSCKDFSCGMWRVLHLITLSVNHEFPADEAMRSVRFVVDNFFSCALCREHFLKHYDNCDFGRCDMQVDEVNVPAWLVRLHNGVNERLNKPVWPNAKSWTNEELFNYLKNVYGISSGNGRVVPLSIWLVLVVLAGILTFTCVRYLGSTTVDRIRYNVTKKFQPLNIV